MFCDVKPSCLSKLSRTRYLYGLWRAHVSDTKRFFSESSWSSRRQTIQVTHGSAAETNTHWVCVTPDVTVDSGDTRSPFFNVQHWPICTIILTPRNTRLSKAYRIWLSFMLKMCLRSHLYIFVISRKAWTHFIGRNEMWNSICKNHEMFDVGEREAESGMWPQSADSNQALAFC